MQISIFISQKSSQILRESLCRPLSGMGEIENYIKYLSNTPKYTTSVPYWMLNNLFSDITLWMHNNLNVIIKIFSTILLSLTVLFPSVPLEGIPTFLLVTIGKRGVTCPARSLITLVIYRKLFRSAGTYSVPDIKGKIFINQSLCKHLYGWF